ncbi:MAG: RHS repeat domain-containing protein [Terriglobales bacterium]
MKISIQADDSKVVITIEREENTSAKKVPSKDCPCSSAQDKPAESVVQPRVTSDSVTWGYDDLGRLHTVTYQNGTAISYDYDEVGNRTSLVTTCSGGGC